MNEKYNSPIHSLFTGRGTSADIPRACLRKLVLRQALFMFPTHHLFGILGMLHAALSILASEKMVAQVNFKGQPYELQENFLHGTAAMALIACATVYWLAGKWANKRLSTIHSAIALPYSGALFLISLAGANIQNIFPFLLFLFLAGLILFILNTFFAVYKRIIAKPNDSRKEPPGPEVE